jgi:catechol 2,3-dioxygenase-like lactoylglutathione lyase family enzyme
MIWFGDLKSREHPMQLQGAHHIALYTANYPALLDFYVSVLGLPVVGGFPDEPIVFLDAGGTTIELTGGEQPGEPRGQGWNHLALEVADLEAAVGELEARGVHFHIRPMGYPPAAPTVRTAFFRDPDGNELELIQPLGARYPELPV